MSACIIQTDVSLHHPDSTCSRISRFQEKRIDGLQRNGKSFRLRWINYLRPGLQRGMPSAEEEETILALHRR
ncbi:hypothetical protein NC651_028064 [Populus alba x Populus x berolinensis]|nr:hypothetical protein NC651_028064 [Populus alba x Populus x berolinensis]